MKQLLMFFSIFLPWMLRRHLLRACFGYEIHDTAHIGLAWVFPNKLIMERKSSIGDFTVCKGQDLVKIGEYASIGRGNWITAFPSKLKDHFQANKDRSPALILGEQAAITSRHLIDCTDRVSIGKYSILAGFQSQILTHSIDFKECKQSCQPVSIGDYSFVGTNSVFLPGSSLPDFSILGAKSLVNQKFQTTYQLYAGVPAQPLKALDQTDKYFLRSEGFIN